MADALQASEMHRTEQAMLEDSIRQSENDLMMAEVEDAIMRESREAYYASMRGYNG